MKSVRILHAELPDLLVQAIGDGDAALWIGPGMVASSEAIESLCRLVSLPWRLVLCESNDLPLTQALDAISAPATGLDRRRGFVHVVASDPEGTQLPPRALPVFLLNARRDSRQAEESVSLTEVLRRDSGETTGGLGRCQHAEERGRRGQPWPTLGAKAPLLTRHFRNTFSPPAICTVRPQSRASRDSCRLPLKPKRRRRATYLALRLCSMSLFPSGSHTMANRHTGVSIASM